MRIVLTVPKPTPSLNGLIKQHWSYYKRVRDEWSALLLFAIRNSANYDTFGAKGKRQLFIERHAIQRLDGFDNGPGGCKPVVDALCQHKLIVDDTDDWLSASFSQERVAHKVDEKTIFTLDDI